jgi:hypothetical protein
MTDVPTMDEVLKDALTRNLAVALTEVCDPVNQASGSPVNPLVIK